MRVIFSKNRAAQLDLLLRSLSKNAPGETTRILWTATTRDFRQGYEASPFYVGHPTPSEHFNAALRDLLADGEMVTFFCDDDVLYRPIPHLRLDDPKMLCFSLRLGLENAQQEHPMTRNGTWEWAWEPLPRTDFGFPCSIDGHRFRTADVLKLIGDEGVHGPTQLETIMAARVDVLNRPLMGCFASQRLVGVPVNRVSDSSGCPAGLRFPQGAEELNDRFLAGQRINLEALDFSGVDGCHHEIRFAWQ